MAILGFFFLIAIIGPYIAPYDPSARSDDILQPPSWEHWFGTTHLGQDVFSQILVGTRGVIVVGFVAGIVATTIGVIVGVTAGYVGGLGDESLSVLANVFLVIPQLPLIILIAGQLPTVGGVTVALVIAVTGWAWGARVLRAQTLSLRRRDFVEAARANGERTWRIITAEILPNLTAIIAGGLRRHGRVRGALAHHAVVHRHRQHRRVELGHRALPGAVAARAPARRLVVVRAGRPLHRAARDVARRSSTSASTSSSTRACARPASTRRHCASAASDPASASRRSCTRRRKTAHDPHQPPRPPAEADAGERPGARDQEPLGRLRLRRRPRARAAAGVAHARPRRGARTRRASPAAASRRSPMRRPACCPRPA